MSSVKLLEKNAEIQSFHFRHEIERYQAERCFAEFLVEQDAESKTDMSALLDQADAIVASAVKANVAVDGIRDAVRKAEAVLAPLQSVAKTFVIHCVGHAHIDMNWMWSWPETVAVTNDSFTTVLKLMEEFPDFHFSQSQASVYAIIEKFNPAMLQEIAARVEEGRWELTGSHWVEGDKNLANGESLCRHILYTKQYFKEVFDVEPDDIEIDWAPDTFGHALTVPGYLVRGGIRYCYLHRPGYFGDKRPEVFWWQGVDGSKVLVRNDMKLAYNGVISGALSTHLVNYTKETGLKDYMFVYGVGDHGGGPTRRDLMLISEMKSWPIFPTVKFSKAINYFKAIETADVEIPTLDIELNPEFAGCYTTQTVIKKANRYGENRLFDAEFAAGLDWIMQAGAYPDRQLREGWINTLFSQFHDILPGSGVHDTRTYCHGQFQETMAMTSMVETNALRRFAGMLNTQPKTVSELDSLPAIPASYLSDCTGSGAGISSKDGSISTATHQAGNDRPFVFFNPSGVERREVVTVTLWDKAPLGQGRALGSEDYAVETPAGDLIPVQTLNAGAEWGHQFLKVCFPVTVPANGYAVYHVITGVTAPVTEGESALGYCGKSHHCRYSAVERGAQGIENEHICLIIDPRNGGILSMMDKASGTEVIKSDDGVGLPILEYLIERSHPMSSWLIDHAMDGKAIQVRGIKRVGDGPYSIGLEMDIAVSESQFTLTMALKRNDPKLYLQVAGTWFERGTPETGIPSLNFAFPFRFEEPVGNYEIPFGSIERQHNDYEELPALQWASVSGKIDGNACGCLLLNESKYGHSLSDGTLRLSLVRSSYQPDPLPEIGFHEVRVALLPFAGPVAKADATHAGHVFNHPLRAISTGVHSGRFASSASMYSLDQPNVVVSTFKKAEGNDSLILRVYEAEGSQTRTVLTLNREFFGAVKEAELTDLLERRIDGDVTAEKDHVVFEVPANGIVTLKIKTEQMPAS